MKIVYLLRTFLFIFISIFIILLLEMSIFDMINRTINFFFIFSIFLVIVFWLLSIHSFYKFSLFLNQEQMSREADRLQLEESQKMIQILRSQRHDFKNQLQVIRIMAQSKRHNAIVDYIQDCNESLDYSKEIPYQIDNAALSAMAIFFATQARENGINFSVESDLDFTKFHLSPAKITRILGNIIRNAIEVFQTFYSKEREIKLTMWETGSDYYFVIWNNGPLIPKEIQELIFRPGYSGKNSTGLGLSIVKHLVEEMDGKVNLKSSQDEGTEFYIVIPRPSQRTFSASERLVDNFKADLSK
jgi:two-component system sensor histidine kinase AgrC